MRTQVAIIGAGPAGMVLGHLLGQAGLDVLILEKRSRDYVEARVRAGLLEQTTVDVLRSLGLADRLLAEGLAHAGVRLQFEGEPLRIDLAGRTQGRGVTVYGQQEVMRDLFDGAARRGLRVAFGCEVVGLEGLSGRAPSLTWRQEGEVRMASCDFVVGCDGQHGAAWASLPEGALTVFERRYPFGWLGVLAEVPPVADELIYSRHGRGFALASLRSPSRSRYYLQCPLDTRVEDWPDDRFWDELELRLGPAAAAGLQRGPAFEKSIAPLRSVVCEPMQFGRLFLAGDAAHIVPPTGAKGLNLAVADVAVLAEALIAHYAEGDAAALADYSRRALKRVWRAERFSWWFTRLMHAFPDATAFDQRIQQAEFEHLAASAAVQTAFAEAYAGQAL